MARYTRTFRVNANLRTVHADVDHYLLSEGYECINYDGEEVYKKGQGFWGSPTFFKISYCNNIVKMETWMKYALLPGVYIGEIGVTGFVGWAVKGPWKKRITDIENILLIYTMQHSEGYPSTPSQNNHVSINNNETQMINDDYVYEEMGATNENKVKTAEAEKPVFCNECGSQLPQAAQFCPACGRKCAEIPMSNMSSGQQTAHTSFYQLDQFDYNTENTLHPSGCSISRKEFIEKFALPSLRKEIKDIAILCYVCAGMTFAVSCFLNPRGIIDAVVLAVFALGMHLAKSKVCAYLILILSIVEVVLSLFAGSFPFWWLVAGISSVVVFNKIDRQYKEFLKR